MPNLFSNTRWTSEQPAIYLTADYDIGTRTSTTVQVRMKVTVHALPGPAYFGLSIKSKVKLAGTEMCDWVTMKNNSPNMWQPRALT